MIYEPKQLQALAAVVDEQGFEKAAELLHVTQSAISQRIRQLEKQLGEVLVVRSNPPALTETGHKVMNFYRQLEVLQTEFTSSLPGHSEESWNRISIGTNADSLCTWLPEALSSLTTEYHIRLDLKVDDQDQTHELLRRGEVMACISARQEAEAGCNCIPLGIMRYRSLASPAFIQEYFDKGVNPETILKAPCVEFSHKDELVMRYLKKHFGHDRHPITHRIPLTDAYINFMVNGYAWGIVPELQSAELQKTGALQEIVSDTPLDIPLYWHIWNLRSPFNLRLTNNLTALAKQHLLPLSV